MVKKYRRLKAKLFEKGFGQKHVAEWLVRSLSYVSECLNEKNGGFNNEEMLILMERLNISEEDWWLFFGSEARSGR